MDHTPRSTIRLDGERSFRRGLSLFALVACIVVSPVAGASAQDADSSPLPDRDFPFRHEYSTARMRDGVGIALAVSFPPEFDPDLREQKWPALLHSSGYRGETAPADPRMFRNKYVIVSASLRGTGASGGLFQPFHQQTVDDGFDIIEGWIVKQPWSNGRVGVFGRSWPGMTGFLFAASGAPSLKAVTVSALVEDFYRGVFYPGGVRNYGFPSDWLTATYRQDGVHGSDRVAAHLRRMSPEDVQKLHRSRPDRNPAAELLWLTLTEPFDGPRWQERSLERFAGRIRAPIHIMHAYQDEQTGPSGLWLWKHVPEQTPKRLVLTNGVHDTLPWFDHDRIAWLDYWLIDQSEEEIADPSRRVQLYFETAGRHEDGTAKIHEPLEVSDFPPRETDWNRVYLRGGQRLSLDPPESSQKAEGDSDRYEVRVGADDSSLHRLYYALTITEPRVICGPIVADLWIESSTVDTDLFVMLGDLDQEGNLHYLQRGLLRASHREIDPQRSSHVQYRGESLMIRPYRRHIQPVPLTPHKVERVQVEIPPVGHVLRPGHRLVLVLSQPPDRDPIVLQYHYAANRPPGMVRILRDQEHPSHILVPVCPLSPPVPEAAPRPGTAHGIHYERIE